MPAGRFQALEVQLNTAAKQPSAVLPIVMSLAALATVFVHITVSGTQPQADEGTAAHVWQLLMADSYRSCSSMPSSGYRELPKKL
jgi:hypothetical protein